MPYFAAIDAGSNAIRLMIVNTDNAKDTLVERYALRLGSDVFSTGVLQEPTILAFIEVFKTIAAHLKKYPIQAYRAVGTSALRDAKNNHEVIHRVKTQTDIELEIITGKEEASLMRAALLYTMGELPEQTLLIDLGGGSLEIEQLYSQHPAQSLALGTVRLVQQYPQFNKALSVKELETFQTLIEQQVKNAIGDGVQPTSLGVGISGNFEALARLLPQNYQHHLGIDLKKLPVLALELAVCSNEQRILKYQLKPDRADLILPAILVTDALVKLYHLKQFAVPKTGLREALIQQLLSL